MRSKMMRRYYCEFCGKGGMSSHHMVKHEKHCTMNPDRKCRMCAFIDNASPNTREFIARVPVPEYDKEVGSFLWVLINRAEIAAAISKILVDSCPACSLAVLRQTKIHSFEAGFDYKKECVLFWKGVVV